jgi:hypothetical protein
LINQRQGGRRRGRGQRGQNLGGQPGNRQDNRQRGNAAQLLEKYKNLARDAQLAGDRVQTEYYLQYADHYFRVLGENRARFEDQRRQRGEDIDEDEGEDELAETAADAETSSEEREPRRERFNRRDRERDRDRPRRFDREERASEESDEDAAPSRMNGRDDSLPLDVLPPAIGADGPTTLAVEDEEPAPAKPRRRTRARPAADEDAPAA